MNSHKFTSWFAHKLTVGPMPNQALKDWHVRDYDFVINVSDEYYHGERPMYQHCQYHWFPMNEQKGDMGLNSIYGAIVILKLAELDGKRVYLHCHSGSNRSWTVAAAYYYFRTGTHLHRPEKSGEHENKLLKNSANAYLPPRAELEAFLRELKKELDEGMMSGILTMAKINAIKNF